MCYAVYMHYFIWVSKQPHEVMSVIISIPHFTDKKSKFKKVKIILPKITKLGKSRAGTDTCQWVTTRRRSINTDYQGNKHFHMLLQGRKLIAIHMLNICILMLLKDKKETDPRCCRHRKNLETEKQGQAEETCLSSTL